MSEGQERYQAAVEQERRREATARRFVVVQSGDPAVEAELERAWAPVVRKDDLP